MEPMASEAAELEPNEERTRVVAVQIRTESTGSRMPRSHW
jgi:hypothetical protein